MATYRFSADASEKLRGLILGSPAGDTTLEVESNGDRELTATFSPGVYATFTIQPDGSIGFVDNGTEAYIEPDDVPSIVAGLKKAVVKTGGRRTRRRSKHPRKTKHKSRRR